MTYSPERYQKYKACIAAAKKRYYEKNKESILKKQKEYDDTHRDLINKRRQTNSKQESSSFGLVPLSFA